MLDAFRTVSELVEAAPEAAEISEQALIAAVDTLGVRAKKGEKAPQASGAAGKGESNGRAIVAAKRVIAHSEPLHRSAERAKALVREQLKYGPRLWAQIEAAAEAAEIPERALIAATDELGVRTKRGEWRLRD